MSRAVISVIRGGIGNQLFSYAAARALALRTQRALYLDTQLGFVDDSFQRSYSLHRFPIVAEPIPDAWRIGSSLHDPRHRMVRSFSRFLPRARRSYVSQRNDADERQLTTLVPQARRVTLVGYWQSERYFGDHQATIRRECAPPEPSDERNLRLGAEMAQSESVFLHVRRVRYPDLLDTRYYQAAVAAVLQRSPGARFYIFGDEVQWVVDCVDFAGAATTVVSHNAVDAVADLWLMSRCRHAIAANSSFSWWGAWLGGLAAARFVAFPANPGFPLASATGWQRLPNALVKPATVSAPPPRQADPVCDLTVSLPPG